MFIELTTTKDNKVLLNLASIRYIIPNQNGATVYSMSSSYGNYDQIFNVKSSYEEIKQMLKKFDFNKED